MINIIVSIVSTRYVENYASELTGRKVTIGSVWVNLLRFTVTINDLKMYEQNSDTVFFSFDEFFVNTSPTKYLFSKTIAVSEVYLEEPHITLVMKGDSLNFQDILARFTSKEDTLSSSDSSETIPYVIKDIQLANGAFRFVQSTFNGTLVLKAIEMECPEVSSTNPNVTFELATESEGGGDLSLNGNVHLDSLSYQVGIKSKAFTLDFLLPFVDKVLYAKSINGFLDVDMNVYGNINTTLEGASGVASLSEFVMTDTAGNASVKCKKIGIIMDSLNALKGNYDIQKVEVIDPYLRFDITKSGNNLYREFTAPDSTATDSLQAPSSEVDNEYMNFFRLLNDYFYAIGREYTVNFYNIDSVSLRNGSIHFNDYTLDQQFSFKFDSLDVNAHHVRSDRDTLLVEAHAALNRSGIFTSRLLLNPKQVGDMQLYYTIAGLKVTDFSPYSEYYVAHPFWDGVVFLESTSTVKNKWLVSKNHLLVKKLEVGDKVHNKTALDLPLKLAITLLRDMNGNIDLDLPLKGNVDDPKFRVMPILFKILKNVIVKAAAAPYKLLAQGVDADSADLHDIKFNYLQSDLRSRQLKGLNFLSRILNQKKEMQVTLVHMSNPDWEKKQYALFEAKRKYYMQKNAKTTLTSSDTLAIDNISRLDSAFTTFLTKESGTVGASTTEAMALKLAGEQNVQTLLDQVERTRKENVIQYLQSKVEGTPRYKIVDAKPAEKVSYQERPKFVLVYSAL